SFGCGVAASVGRLRLPIGHAASPGLPQGEAALPLCWPRQFPLTLRLPTLWCHLSNSHRHSAPSPASHSVLFPLGPLRLPSPLSAVAPCERSADSSFSL